MIETELKESISKALANLYQLDIKPETIAVEATKSDFEGDFTFVVFPYLKSSRKSAEQTANEIGEQVQNLMPAITSFNVIKGFLNFSLSNSYWTQFLLANAYDINYGLQTTSTGKKVVVEYSSPNTNKPLHLGHVRNILLGYSVANILKANGHEVVMCSLINDRGIHICKSMLAWMQFGNNETPESSGIKGDHLVGKYYVEFDKQYKKQIEELKASGIADEDAEKNAPLMLQAQELLRKWEAGDEAVIKVWKQMNEWVYDGFGVTYNQMGIYFDKNYYESNTYLLGKKIVAEGLEKKAFYQRPDGSVWIDLTAEGLDEKLLLRADGTSVYITQDIGTAQLKYDDYAYDESIYVVGNEQDYHFKVLKHICDKMQKPYAKGIFHLSYGMVELPQGKMKSREGTVVDADDLMQEMIDTATQTTIALGKTGNLPTEELNKLYEVIGLGALKYFLLKVDPKKKMLFNPAESIDFHGNTGPFIQYTHARIRSILRNAGNENISIEIANYKELHPLEKSLIKWLYQFPQVVKQAGAELSPGLVANYIYEVAKSFNQFYHELSVLHEPDAAKKNLRLHLTALTGTVIKSGFKLLGIEVPERM